MKELEEREHIWLESLSKKLGKEGLKRLIRKAEGLEGVHSRSLADDVLQLAVNANKDVVEILKGEDSMCRALMEIMKPEIEAEVEARVKEKMDKIEEERGKAEKERAEAEQERVKAQQEIIKIEQERVQMILDMAKESFSLTMIAKLVRKPLDEVQKILQSQGISI